jgi:DNA-directed RNA polymerase subunit omega
MTHSQPHPTYFAGSGRLTESPAMIEALKSDSIVDKVGGRFKLCTLIQRRLIQLMEGSRPLVERNGRSDLELVIEEIIQDKIYLDATQQVRLAGEFQGTGESMELDLGDL